MYPHAVICIYIPTNHSKTKAWNLKTNLSVTHSHIVPQAVTVMFNIQVREVEKHTVVGIHTDNPGTVHIVGIAARIQRRMDLPWWSCDWTSTACSKESSWLKVTKSADASGLCCIDLSNCHLFHCCLSVEIVHSLGLYACHKDSLALSETSWMDSITG